MKRRNQAKEVIAIPVSNLQNVVLEEKRSQDSGETLAREGGPFTRHIRIPSVMLAA